MATAEIKTRITPEEFLATTDGVSFELVDGELVPRNTCWNSSTVAARLVYLLLAHCKAHPIGKAVGAKAGYQCFPDDPLKVRKPDASFIRSERLPPAEELDGWCRVAPDVAAEVISPNDLAYDVEGKVDEYLRAGVKLVWVIYPRTRTVHVHRADGAATVLRASDFLDGETVLPEFRCAVAELFK